MRRTLDTHFGPETLVFSGLWLHARALSASSTLWAPVWVCTPQAGKRIGSQCHMDSEMHCILPAV